MQLLIGKPDEVFEANGHERLAVGDLHLELYALGIELEGVGNVAEGAGLSQVAAHVFEIIVGDDLAKLQACGGGDLGGGVARRARDTDGDQLGG